MGVGGDCKSDSILRANYLFYNDFIDYAEVVREHVGMIAAVAAGRQLPVTAFVSGIEDLRPEWAAPSPGGSVGLPVMRRCWDVI